MQSKQKTKILEFLQSEQREISTKELQEKLGFSYQVLTRQLRDLTVKKAVLRKWYNDPSNSGYRYKFRQWPRELEREFDFLEINEANQFIRTMSDSSWNPLFARPEVKSFIQQAMLDLHSVKVRLSQGDKVNQKELDEIKLTVKKIFDVLDKARTTLGRLLVTEHLWDKTMLTGSTES